MSVKNTLTVNLVVLGVNGYLGYTALEAWNSPVQVVDLSTDSAALSPEPSKAKGSTRTPANRPATVREYHVVQEKNIFHPDRRPVVPEDEKKTEDLPQAKDSSDYTLTGTMILDNNERFAYLAQKGDNPKRYYLSEEIDGYRLTSIESSEVRLRKGTEELIVKCFTGESAPSGGASRASRRSSSSKRREFLRERRLRKARERNAKHD